MHQEVDIAGNLFSDVAGDATVNLAILPVCKIVNIYSEQWLRHS